MIPKKRYLRGNKGSEAPGSYLFFDCETWRPARDGPTDTKELHLRLWCARYVRLEKGKETRVQERHGFSAQEFWNWVETLQHPSKPLWAFSHNIGVDLTWLKWWDELEAGRYTIGPVDRGISKKTGQPIPPWKGRLCLEARPTFAVVMGQRGKVRFVDTGNYWPVSLPTLGQSIGLEKFPMPSWDAPEEHWLAYCWRDVEVISKAVLGLVGDWVKERCGVFKMTAPSLAWTNWRHTTTHRAKKGDAVRLVLEDDSPARPLEREAYYGGRIQPFYLGELKGRWHLVDCVSLYPFIMKSELFPFERVEQISDPTPTKLMRGLACGSAVARVRIRSKWPTYPIRANGVQCHAHGDFWTSLCGAELRRALYSGHVVDVSEAHSYSTADMFGSWVDRWARMKTEASQAGDSGRARYQFAKLMLNSLSGKFGQRGHGWIDRPELGHDHTWGQWVDLDPETRQPTLYRSVAGVIQSHSRDMEPPEAWPIVSAHITSGAREYMRDVMERLPENSVAYIGTDGLIVSDDGLAELRRLGLMHETELGKFRLVDSADYVAIHGPNWYTFGEKVVRSGSWARAKYHKEHGWLADIWQQLPSLIAQRPDGTVKIIPVKLRRQKATAKGIKLADGWLRPFCFTRVDGWTDSKPRVGYSLPFAGHSSAPI